LGENGQGKDKNKNGQKDLLHSAWSPGRRLNCAVKAHRRRAFSMLLR